MIIAQSEFKSLALGFFMNEKSIENLILQYLDLKSLYPCKLENQGTFDPIKKAYRGNRSKFKRDGLPDIMCFYLGKVVYFEVKKPEEYKYIVKHYDRLRKGLVKSKIKVTNQINFHEQVIKRGQYAFFTDSIQRTEELLDKISQQMIEEMPDSEH